MVRVGFLCRNLVLWSTCEIFSLVSLGFHLQCNCNLLIQEWKKICGSGFLPPFPCASLPCLPLKHLWGQEGWLLPSWMSLVPGQAQQDTLSHTLSFSTDHWGRENWVLTNLFLGPDSCLEHALFIFITDIVKWGDGQFLGLVSDQGAATAHSLPAACAADPVPLIIKFSLVC